MNETVIKQGQRGHQVTSIDLSPNQRLFEEGDRGHEFYVLESGTIEVIQNQGPDEVVLATMTQGSILGEMALFDGQTRSATARAKDHCQVKVIPESAFRQMMKLLPVWLRAIINIVVSRVREANKRLELHTIPKLTFSLNEYLITLSTTNQTTELDFLETLHSYLQETRAHREEFNETIEKLCDQDLVKVTQHPEGHQYIELVAIDKQRAISKLYIALRAKQMIFSKELNHDSKQILKYLHGTPPEVTEWKKELFIDNLISFNPRLSESSLSQLIKFRILKVVDEHLTINQTEYHALLLEAEVLPILKELLK